MTKLVNSNVFFATTITALIFLLFITLCKPIINSDDNFYILYTLAGGYGNTPTNLLHYIYEWHPLLFWPISKLFTAFPNYNWYTVLLLTFHFFSCVQLFISFILIVKKHTAVILYLVYFLFFESILLLSLNHSNTSIILAISGGSNLLLHFANKRTLNTDDLKKLLIPSILIVFSCLLRVHTLALFTLLSVAIAFGLLPLQYFKKYIISLIFLASILLFLIQGHKIYYKTKIQNFNKEWNFRQQLFYLANHPTIGDLQDTGIAKVKNSFIQSWFIYDTSFVSSRDIEKFTQQKVSNRINQPKENLIILYWIFINNRVYFLLFFTFILIFISQKQYKLLVRWILMSLPGVLTFIYLLIYLKVTEGIFITILSSIFISAAYCLREVRIKYTTFSFICITLFGLSFLWMLLIIKKKNFYNIKNITETRLILKELKENQNILFVNTNEFNDAGFYIWDTPNNFPVKNLINKELLITNSYETQMKRFKIDNLMKSLPYKSYIYVSGINLPNFKDYYKIKYGLDVEVIKVQSFKKLNSYKIELVK